MSSVPKRFSLFLSACLLVLSLGGLPFPQAAASDGFQALDLQLIGIVQSEETQPRALIVAKGLERETLIAEGDLIGGYAVVSVGEEAVEFAKGDDREFLLLNGARWIRSETVKTPLLALSEAEAFPTPDEKAAVGKNEPESAAKIVEAGDLKRRVAIQEIPRFQMPMRTGKVSSPFGLRRRPQTSSGLFGSERHEGVDIAAPSRTPVYAAASGTAIEVGSSLVRGRYVVIRHIGGYETRYYHLYSQSVKQGDTIRAGQLIGAVGSTGISTGPHLHFEIRRNDNPLDPGLFLPALKR